MGYDQVIVRKPRRSYPLPEIITDLDKPWSNVEARRHHRVEYNREGYDKTSGDDPTIVPPGGYDSDILSKL